MKKTFNEKNINIEEIEKELLSNIEAKHQILMYAKFINKEDNSEKTVPYLIALYNNNNDENDYMIFENKFSELVIGLHINESFEYFKENFNDWFIHYDEGNTAEEIFNNLNDAISKSYFSVQKIIIDKEQIENDIKNDGITEEWEKANYYNSYYEEALEEYQNDNLLVIDGIETADILVKPQHYYGKVCFDNNKSDINVKESKVSQEEAFANNTFLIKRFLIEVSRLLTSKKWKFIELEWVSK